jgi:DNA polymerase-3 subunit gamma/tau
MTAAPYRVLARKYRPTTFAELIGQEAMVRTLSNAIRSGRIAQAFMLTGVRGIGKTTTARLIARALNCVGPDGKGGPTVDPCGVCANCVAIAEDRHGDVIEMDAASRTGVDNIRDLIDGVRYLPVEARYKVYILDEVHMLSDKAFNALLKTLEEPPAHVKFVFCTTEIRKVPVTVLSRCQRFDLRRLEAGTLIAHLGRVAASEGAEVAAEALALIARAAEGSVRDGLSLLDQAIAHGAGEVGAEQVRDMLGLADRGRVVDLFELVMRGETAAALAALRAQYDAGADPVVVLQDLLELTHWVTRIKITPEAADDVTVPQAERERGRALAEALPMPSLSRAWQMLLKGLGEARSAPTPLAAAEMVLVRLAYAAELPSPAELVRVLQGAAAPARTAPATGAGRNGDGGGASALARTRLEPPAGGGARPQAALRPAPTAEPLPQAAPEPSLPPPLPDFAAVVALFGERREPRLKAELVNHAHLVRFEPGRIELRLDAQAPRTLASDVMRRLREWTGGPWVVVISNEPGEPTLAEQAAARGADRRARAAAHPLVRAALAAFPGAELVAVRELPKPAFEPGAGEPPGEDDGADTTSEDA